jgi:hypothetical protein
VVEALGVAITPTFAPPPDETIPVAMGVPAQMLPLYTLTVDPTSPVNISDGVTEKLFGLDGTIDVKTGVAGGTLSWIYTNVFESALILPMLSTALAVKVVDELETTETFTEA